MNGLAEDPGTSLPAGPAGSPRSATGQLNVDGDVRELDTEGRRRLRRRPPATVRGRHRDTGPWFAVWAPSTPHDPYTPSPEHRHDFDDVRWDPPAFNEADMSDKPTWMRNLPRQERAQMRDVLEGKLEELQDLDDQVGLLLDVLWRTDQLDRTWIFFVADNGFLLGEHRLFRKEQPYEESTGIPYVVRGPGVARAARNALVSQVDLMPTTLEIAGLDPDAGRELSAARCCDPCAPATGRRGVAGCWSRTRTWSGRCSGRGPWPTSSTTSAASGSSTTWQRDPHQLSSRRDAEVGRFAERLDRLRQSSGTTLRALED